MRESVFPAGSTCCYTLMQVWLMEVKHKNFFNPKVTSSAVRYAYLPWQKVYNVGLRVIL